MFDPGTKTKLQNIHAQYAAGGNISAINLSGTYANPGLQKLIAACIHEMDAGTVTDKFVQELAHFRRPPTERNLEIKLKESGQKEAYYDFAIEAKEAFAKFFEVLGRHPSGQLVMIAAFSHAYSIFREKIAPNIADMSFSDQSDLFESEIVVFLSHNLTGLPGFYGRNEALGLLFYLADNCFIEYAHV